VVTKLLSSLATMMSLITYLAMHSSATIPSRLPSHLPIAVPPFLKLVLLLALCNMRIAEINMLLHAMLLVSLVVLTNPPLFKHVPFGGGHGSLLEALTATTQL